MKRLGFLLVLVALAYGALPYWSAYSLSAALRDGDEKTLESKVDWPNLRSALSADLATAASQSAGTSLSGLLRAAAGASVMDSVIDVALTPQTIARVMRESRAVQQRMGTGDETASPQAEATEDPAPLADVRYAFFDDINTFRVSLAPHQSDVQTDLIFERSGLEWPLVRLNLPDQVLAGLTN